MNNVIDLWKFQEINNLKKSIKEAESLIKQFDLELADICKIRHPSIKDFGVLIQKYGNKNLNKSMIGLYYQRLIFLRNMDISEEEYYRIGIL